MIRMNLYWFNGACEPQAVSGWVGDFFQIIMGLKTNGSKPVRKLILINDIA